MFRGLLNLLLASSSVALALAAQAPAEFYVNRTIVQNPRVNARNFVNEGEISAFGSVPWDAQNTVTFTNRGVMSGSIGYRFETVDDPFGIRTPANSFFNSSAGQIRASDSGGFALIVAGTLGGFQNSQTSLIKVNANNITNRGRMNVGANGFIQLHGRNIDLTAGALIVGDINDPLSGGGSGSGFPTSFDTNFFPAPGIYDSAWGISSYTNARIGGIITSVDPATVSTPTPAPILTNSPFFGGGFPSPIRLDEAQLWIREEVIDETNEVVQIIAVQVSDPNIGTFASFDANTYPLFPQDDPIGGFLTAVVELRVGSTDFATLDRVTNSLYIADQLGSHTNRVLMENINFGTFRPGNFIVFRDDPDLFGGQPASTNLRDDILTARMEGTNSIPYLNTGIFSNDWSGYQAVVESVAAQLPVVPGATVTNLGGQVEVNAQQLNLINTRIRGEGFVSLTATNVTIGGSNLVDVPRISLNFGTGSDTLRVNEFVPDFVERFQGSFYTYGTLFTNYYERYVTNTPTDPADTNITVVTNPVEVRFHVTIVDARGLQTTEQVTVYDLKLSSTNTGTASLFFNENLTLFNAVRIDTRQFTLMEGSGLRTLQNVGFSYTNLLNIRTFTNLGTLQISEFADLRQAEFTPYERFFNGGFIDAYGVEIWTDEFSNTGAILVDSIINIRARNLAIDSGFFGAGGDIRLMGETARLNNLEASAGARLVLDISQTLTDSGLDAPNSITVEAGVEMSPDRPQGNLLGTTIFNVARPLDLVDFIWSAEDRGASASGYDNLALGQLTLEGGNFSIFRFLQGRENSALYVDVLEISGYHAESLSLITNSIILGMNVYYSDVVSTNTEITADSLNRIFGPDAQFNFIRVPDFVGANSVQVRLGANGAIRRMDRALRQSMVEDSDGDGIPNAQDSYPLTGDGDGGTTAVELMNVARDRSKDSITFSVAGSPSAQYVIEHSSNLDAPEWKDVSGILTSSELNGVRSFSDKIGQGSAQGYYRVRVLP